MKKHLSIFAVISLAALLLGSCGAGEPAESSTTASSSDAVSESQPEVSSDSSVTEEEPASAETSMPYTFTDSMGHTVTLEEKPETGSGIVFFVCRLMAAGRRRG